MVIYIVDSPIKDGDFPCDKCEITGGQHPSTEDFPATFDFPGGYPAWFLR